MSKPCQACGQEAKDVLIVLVLDESGSMKPQTQSTLSAVNEFIEGQKDQPGNAFLMVNTFDSGNQRPNVRTIIEEVPIRDAPKLTAEHYNPWGATPLHDAFGVTMEQVNKIANGRRVLFVVMTDGYENSSEKWNLAKVSREMKKHDWQFVFLGANIDAWGVGHAIGGQMLARNSLGYENNAKGIGDTWTKIGAATASYRASNVTASANFLDSGAEFTVADPVVPTTEESE